MILEEQSTRTRRVLVVAYVFPPAGGAGVQRVTKFVKYLPEFGWDCSVLTVSNPSVPVFDESLVDEIPESTLIRRARTLEPGYALKNVVSAGSDLSAKKSSSGLKKLLKGGIRAVGNSVLQPDAQILWYPQAVGEGMRLLSELDHDAIFVTAPPFSSFVTGAALARRSGLPLIVDYRDEWGISNRYQENRHKSRVSHRIQAVMQDRVLKRASAVIATTRRSRDSLTERVTEAGSDAAVTHIYNGFDAADIRAESLTKSEENDRLRLAYVGTLWNLTSIEPVVDAIRSVAEATPDLAAKIDLTVAGRRTAEQEAVLDRLDGLPCRLIREGYVDHSRALEIMRSSNALCLLLSDVEEAGRVVPAKAFEYLALRQPILSVCPQGEVTEILSGCPNATSFEPLDVSGIANYLTARLDGSHPSPASDQDWNADQYERRNLTGELSEVLNTVCGFDADSTCSSTAAVSQADGVPV